MNKVCIVGCGNVGMAYAHEIALKATFVEELVLIDIEKERASGEALDLMHTMAFAGNYMQIKQGDYKDCKNANLLVFCAGRNQKKGGESRQDLLSSNAKIIKEVIDKAEKSGFNGIYLIASNPVDLLTLMAIKECGISQNRVIGSGTTLDTARLKYVLASNLGINPKSINAYVLGEHGDSEFVAWSVSSISGAKLESNIDKKIKNAIEKKVVNSAYEIIEKKGYTAYGIASCLFAITQAILCNENSILTVSTYHAKDEICYSMPAIIGLNGIVNKINLELSEEEEKKLKKSINALKKAYTNKK